MAKRKYPKLYDVEWVKRHIHLPLAEIGARAGGASYEAARYAINKVLKLNRKPIRPVKLYSEMTKEILIELYINQRLSLYDISQKFGCNSETVRKYMKSFRIPLRNKSECHRAYWERKKRC